MDIDVVSIVESYYRDNSAFPIFTADMRVNSHFSYNSDNVQSETRCLHFKACRLGFRCIAAAIVAKERVLRNERIVCDFDTDMRVTNREGKLETYDECSLPISSEPLCQQIGALRIERI